MLSQILDFFYEIGMKAKDTLYVAMIILIESAVYSMILALPVNYFFREVFKVNLTFPLILCAVFTVNVLMLMVSAKNDVFIPMDMEGEEDE